MSGYIFFSETLQDGQVDMLPHVRVVANCCQHISDVLVSISTYNLYRCPSAKNISVRLLSIKYCNKPE